MVINPRMIALENAISKMHVILNAVKNLPSLHYQQRFFTAFILSVASAKGGCAFGAEGFRMMCSHFIATLNVMCIKIKSVLHKQDAFDEGRMPC
jgi:hypothetical protein